jgi:hypothetical protein
MERTSIGTHFINHMKVTKTKTQYQAFTRSFMDSTIAKACHPVDMHLSCRMVTPIAQKLVHNIQGNDNMPWSQSTRT